MRVSLPDTPVVVLGDDVRLQQVVGNLVGNATKYAPTGGTIAVSAEIDAGHAVIRVRDDGAGIPPDQLDAIFELFAQASPTLARTEGGLGIGLTVVRRLVELHAGSGYLPMQFLSTGTNRREDAYGGRAGNRVRFVVEASP